MVKTCCVYNCRNRADSHARSNSISFFRFPANKRKLQAWVKAINRKDWEPNAHTHVCSEHFVFGWHSDDPTDINYAPTLIPRRKRVKKKFSLDDGPVKVLKKEISKEQEEPLKSIPEDDDMILDLSLQTSTSRLHALTETSYPIHLRDHQYYKQTPWPGKKQKPSKSQPKISRETAAETLLLLAHVHQPNKDCLEQTTNTDYSIKN